MDARVSNSVLKLLPSKQIVLEGPIPVGLAPVLIFTPIAGNIRYDAFFKNANAGGQSIRLGTAPSFGPDNGFLLQVGDTLNWTGFSFSFSAVADIIAAVLDIMIVRSSS